MSHKRWYVITFVLLSIITGVGSILGNIASNVLPETWRPYLWLAWPLFVVFLLASIGLTIWQHHIQQQNISKAQSNQLPEQELQLDATKQIDHLVVSDTPLLQSDLRSTQRVSTENDDFAYDVFISYSAKDRSWVRGELLSSLESRGLRVCIDFRDFVPGAPSVTEMERSVLTSRKTLLILTPEYLESMWAEFEQLMLQTLDPANRKLRLIPLLKAKCDLPLRIRYLTYINFTEPENQEVAWSRLLAALGESPMQGPVSRIVLDSQPHRLREDWGEAPDISFFYGRQEELGKLEKWIVTDHCRLVGILGIGGIGKTVLATKLAKQIQAQFDYIIWRSLLNAPAVEDVLGECILLLSDQQGRDLPESIDKRILRLIDYFRKHRCLLVLDNFEAILQAGDRVGHYRDGYKEYGHVIQQVGEMRHQSCLLLTGREKPKELALSEGEISSVRSLRIEGLSTVEGREILKDKGLFGADETWETLVDDCTGNPLILKLVSGVIREVFGGDIASFLQTGAVISDDVYVLLDQQFNRLSELEQEIMYWLAIEREAIVPDDLQEDIVRPIAKRELLEALMSLRRRYLIEKSATGFTLQNVVTEYMTDRLVNRVCQEIMTEALSLFESHALIKAHAKNYVRESQIRLILKPIAQRLLNTLSQKGVEEKLKRILTKLREAHPQKPGYAAGNILNLLVQLQSDLRGWNFSHLTVWQAYLQGVTLPDVNFAHSNLSKSVFTGTFDSIISVAFSPNGELLAGGTANNEIRLWRANGSAPLLACQGHTGWIWSVTFSPDGKVLASGSGDQTVRLWDISTGQCLNTLQGHGSWVRSVAFSPNGKLLASGSEDQTVWLWDVSTGQRLMVLHGHTHRVLSVAFSPNGKLLASSSDDQTVRLWDVGTGQCLETLHGHTNRVYAVAFSPDGRLLASSSEDQTVRLWDANTWQSILVLSGHTNRIRSVAFSPDGKILASGSEDQTVRLWDVGTGQYIIALYGHTGQIWPVAFSPDGKILASGSEDQTVRLWDVGTGQCLKTLQGYVNRVRSTAFSPDGKLLASSADDQTVRLWDLSTGQCLETLYGHTNQIWSVAFSPDGELLASGSYDQTVRLWDLSTGQCVVTLHEHTGWVPSVVFSPNGELLASGSHDQTVRLWDVNTRQCLATLQGHTNRVRSVVFSPDGKLLASGSEDQTVRLWDVNARQCLNTLQGHTSRVRSVAFSPDGKLLASGSDDQTARLWDVNTRQCISTLRGHTHRVWSVAFSPDGRVLASGSEDQTVRLWDVGTGQCISTLQGHAGEIWAVAFSPDGKLLASGSYGGFIELWDSQTGKCLETLKSDRPYERMNITGVRGLLEAQKATLRVLGAIEDFENNE